MLERKFESGFFVDRLEVGDLITQHTTPDEQPCQATVSWFEVVSAPQITGTGHVQLGVKFFDWENPEADQEVITTRSLIRKKVDVWRTCGTINKTEEERKVVKMNQTKATEILGLEMRVYARNLGQPVTKDLIEERLSELAGSEAHGQKTEAARFLLKLNAENWPHWKRVMREVKKQDKASGTGITEVATSLAPTPTTQAKVTFIELCSCPGDYMERTGHHTSTCDKFPGWDVNATPEVK